jgi:hypothetical protein
MEGARLGRAARRDSSRSVSPFGAAVPKAVGSRMRMDSGFAFILARRAVTDRARFSFTDVGRNTSRNNVPYERRMCAVAQGTADLCTAPPFAIHERTEDQ